jgi:putative membrane protein insertion efficiency factor
VKVVAARVLAFLIGLPRLAVIGLLIAYRKVVSPLYGPVCRFYPSCSAYALEAVTVHGFVRGLALGSRRLAHCHPWNDGGVDHVPEGSRTFPAGKVPSIVVLNHPVIPADDESRPAARGAN